MKIKVLKVIINDNKEYESIYTFFDGCGKIFRGQSNASWNLEPSLERKVPHERLTPQIDRDLLDYYKQNSQRFNQKNLTDLDKMILIQHYGGKTRLLDFTKDMNVALFFALYPEPSKKNILNRNESAAIWVLDMQYFFNKSKQIFPKLDLTEIFKKNHIKFKGSNKNESIPLAKLNQASNEITSDILYRIGLDEDYPKDEYGIHGFSVPPYKFKKRLYAKILRMGRIDAQKSYFVMPLNLSKTFEQNLFEVENTHNLIEEAQTMDVSKFMEEFRIQNRDELNPEEQILFDKLTIKLHNTVFKLIFSQNCYSEFEKYLNLKGINYPNLYLDIENIVKYYMDIFVSDNNFEQK